MNNQTIEEILIKLINLNVNDKKYNEKKYLKLVKNLLDTIMKIIDILILLYQEYYMIIQMIIIKKMSSIYMKISKI